MHMFEIVTESPTVSAYEEQLKQYYDGYAPELRKYYLEQAIERLNSNQFAGFKMLLEHDDCPKHPIFLNEVLKAIIKSQCNIFEQLHLIRELLTNVQLLNFLKSFPHDILCRTPRNFISYNSAIVASLSNIDILKTFMEMCGQEAVIQGALGPAVKNKNIDALKFLLPACEPPQIIDELVSECNMEVKNNETIIARLKHMQNIINNNISRMLGSDRPVAKSPESRAVYGQYLDNTSTDVHLNVQEMILAGKFNEAKEFLSRIDKSKGPWAKYEYLYIPLLQSTMSNKNSPKQEVVAFVEFLLEDPKFKNIWQIIVPDTSQIVINNDIQVMRVLINVDNGKTIAKSEALYNSVTHINIAMFELLMQNSEVVGACDSKRLIAALDARLKHHGYNGGIEQQKQVLNLLVDRTVELQTVDKARKGLKLLSV